MSVSGHAETQKAAIRQRSFTHSDSKKWRGSEEFILRITEPYDAELRRTTLKSC